MRKTVAVDFDGVIHWYRDGWRGGEIYDEPVPGAFGALRRLREQFDVVIFTTRVRSENGDLTGVAAIREWFVERGAPDLVDIPVTDRKPLAVAYVDDRAVAFRHWPQAEVELRELLR